MPYSEHEIARLNELCSLVEDRKEHEYAAPTYRDSVALRGMVDTILHNQDTDTAALQDRITVLRYLTDAYYHMGRSALANNLYPHLLAAHAALWKQKTYEEAEEDALAEAIRLAVKARCYYEPAAYDDLLALVEGTFSAKRIMAEAEAGCNARKGLPQDDPIEASEEYLAIIDEVEELIDHNKTMDFCMEYWNLKGQYLAERGIHWRSPVILNPGVMFD